jgi:hypothetical protein
MKRIDEMTLDECHEAQLALLYPWEVDAWERSVLDWDDRSERSILMDALDVQINALLDAVVGREPPLYSRIQGRG